MITLVYFFAWTILAVLHVIIKNNLKNNWTLMKKQKTALKFRIAEPEQLFIFEEYDSKNELLKRVVVGFDVMMNIYKTIVFL